MQKCSYSVFFLLISDYIVIEVPPLRQLLTGPTTDDDLTAIRYRLLAWLLAGNAADDNVVGAYAAATLVRRMRELPGAGYVTVLLTLFYLTKVCDVYYCVVCVFASCSCVERACA